MDTNAYRDVFTTIREGFHISKASATLPASTTQNLFAVSGGHVLVSLLLGRVTTVFQNSDPVLKVTATPTAGTAVDVASTVDTTSLEVGGMLTVEGDGTALIKNNSGAALPSSGIGLWICAPGTIDLISGATKTGATKWDIWYLPLDAGAVVVSA